MKFIDNVFAAEGKVIDFRAIGDEIEPFFEEATVFLKRHAKFIERDMGLDGYVHRFDLNGFKVSLVEDSFAGVALICKNESEMKQVYEILKQAS
jgi:hypothetical protein